MNRAMIGVVVMTTGLGVATCASLLKTKGELTRSTADLTASIATKTTDRWTGTNRKTSDRLINEWNDGREGRAYVLVPDADDIIAGIEAPRPMAKASPPPSNESATVRFSWESGGVLAGIDRTGDGSDPFIDRAVHGFRRLESQVPSNK